MVSESVGWLISLSKRKWATKKKCSHESHLQQLRILARSLDFTDGQVMTAGIKGRLLIMVLRKFSSEYFDTPEEKKNL